MTYDTVYAECQKLTKKVKLLESIIHKQEILIDNYKLVIDGMVAENKILSDGLEKIANKEVQ
jgi:hypothetical protein